jgi:hypothetical protein
MKVLDAAVQRAREDIPSKSFDNLTTEQKKIIANVPLEHADLLQLLTDFPEE